MSASVLFFLALTSCKKDKPGPGGDSGDGGADSPILDVPETSRTEIPGMACDAHVLRTAGNVPHIYAHDRADLARALGFVQAQDRYFEMELARRLGLGTLSEILGADALEADMESRATGMTAVADGLLATFSEEQATVMDAYAEGVNAYIAQVKAGTLDLPSELEIAGPFLGVSNPSDLMHDWARRDLAGVAAVLVYELGYETDDVGRAATAAVVDQLFDEKDALGSYRQQGVLLDIWSRITPVIPASSTNGWGENGVVPAPPPAPMLRPGLGKAVPADMLAALAARLERQERRLGRGDLDAGWGSNVWAANASVTADGTAMMAGDGHLPLSVPSLFWQMGLDTRELGGGDTHQLGLGIPGLPILAVGTNGQVAWSQTQIMGDITDWYREEIQLDGSGMPAQSRFQGAWQPLQVVDETHTIADVPLLGSEGGSLTWQRYMTFDGRWITDIEGVEVADDQPGVVFPGRRVSPQDIDSDGVITAISFDYTAFSDGNMLTGVDGFGHAGSVEDFKAATRYLVAYSQNMGVADASGSVLYTGLQAIPCRGYLPRDDEGRWLEGADPTLLIDGTEYGGFTIPVEADGRVLEGQTDPYACVVPSAEYPTALDPAQGFIVNANNDPGGFTLDNDLYGEPWYIGGPWTEGFRAGRIQERLETDIAAGSLDEDAMASIQADHHSALGEWFSWHLVESIELGRMYSLMEREPGSVQDRIAALYLADSAAMDEVQTRLEAWASRGYPAESGVSTFYHSPTSDMVQDSIATSIFNAWLGKWGSKVLDDEGLPGVWNGGGTTGRVRALTMFLEGRGDGNPGDLASWVPETEESAFFDILGTETLESSHEVALMALGEALDFLESPPDEDLRGSGFGTADMESWKWGMRHQTRFESVLADFLDGDEFSFITDQFAISTETLPLDGEAGTEDLDWFPRPGDNLSVDAANSGWGTDFTHGSGPVFRMVISLKDGDFYSGRNVIPGGQSALIDSPYFADQAALWLANETLPMHFFAADVASNASGREVLAGSGGDCN